MAAPRALWLLLSMVGTVLVVGALAYWDEAHRSDQALKDLGRAQAAIARAASLAIGNARDAGVPDGVDGADGVDGRLRELERDLYGARVVLVPPNGGKARLLDGQIIDLPNLVAAAARDDHVLRVSRADAPALGLPARTAMVGIVRLANGWSLAVASSAERQRDRELGGLYRTLAAMALAVGIVTAFGGIAQSRQRKQLEIARELAVADVARAKDAELERLSRSATMAALGSGVAHELSTPLGVIVGRAEQLLVRANGDERARKAARTILDQAEHIEAVVRGLLGLARGAPIELQDVQPRGLVREAAELVAHRFARAEVKLLPVVGPDLPTIRCEPLLLKHALINLLLNACDASRSGDTVRLEVQADCAEVAFVVVDTGDGITPANAARATAPFFTTKPVGQGSGLGLAIANEIASTHRGSLSIGATSPQGTRACITIPTGHPHA